MKTIYTAAATTNDGQDGSVISDDGVVDMRLSSHEIPGNEVAKGTNPEQLFAAGYSASYSAALQYVAAEHNIDLGDFSVTANVVVGQIEGEGFQFEVTLDSYLPGLDVETGEKLVDEAYEVCLYSRATEDNIDVTLNLLLDD